MKTFKFLTLSLLIATIGLYNSVNSVEASEYEKLKKAYLNFNQELWNLTKTKNLREIADKTKIPFNVLRDYYVKLLPLVKKVDEVYNNTPEANRTLRNITKTLNKNRVSGYKDSEEVVARLLKAMEYDFIDEKENTNNSYKVVISNNVKEDVSENEKKAINDEIRKKGNTIKTVSEKFGKSEEEIKRIFMESWDLVPIVFRIWNELSRLGCNNIYDLFYIVGKEYRNGEREGTEILFRQVKEICDKFNFHYTYNTEYENEQ